MDLPQFAVTAPKPGQARETPASAQAARGSSERPGEDEAHGFALAFGAREPSGDDAAGPAPGMPFAERGTSEPRIWRSDVRDSGASSPFGDEVSATLASEVGSFATNEPAVAMIDAPVQPSAMVAANPGDVSIAKTPLLAQVFTSALVPSIPGEAVSTDAPHPIPPPQIMAPPGTGALALEGQGPARMATAPEPGLATQLKSAQTKGLPEPDRTAPSTDARQLGLASETAMRGGSRLTSGMTPITPGTPAELPRIPTHESAAGGKTAEMTRQAASPVNEASVKNMAQSVTAESVAAQASPAPAPKSPAPVVAPATSVGGEGDVRQEPHVARTDTVPGHEGMPRATPALPGEAVATGSGTSLTMPAASPPTGPDLASLKTDVVVEPLIAEVAGSDPLRVDRAPSALNAPAPPTQSETARAIAAQVAEAVRTTGDGRVEVTLRPEELGRLSLTFNTDGGVMTVSLGADRQDTLDLIRRHIDLLERDLREMGFENLNFDFSGQGETDPETGQGQQGAGSTTGGSSPDAVSPAAQTPAPLRTASGGMDLRL